MALAIASGATPVQGIITAFWAGLIGAILGGGHFNIIGPTGALSGILISFAIINGPASLPIITIASGLIILAFYIFKLDKYIIFIPRSVVQGFTLGVAFMIAFGQIDAMLGINDLQKGENVAQNIILAFSDFSKIRWGIFLIFLGAVAFILLWDKKFKNIPGSIIIAFIGIIAVYIIEWTSIPFDITILSDRYPKITPRLFDNFIKT